MARTFRLFATTKAQKSLANLLTTEKRFIIVITHD